MKFFDPIPQKLINVQVHSRDILENEKTNNEKTENNKGNSCVAGIYFLTASCTRAGV